MKAIVLLSGGLDSAVILARVCAEAKSCTAISFDYGQRHRIELEYAKKIAEYYQVSHEIIPIDPLIFQGASSLTSNMVPQKDKSFEEILLQKTPSTYVPARNTLFLAFALVKAEIYQAQEIYFGANAMDYGSYPDCRPLYFEALQELFNQATKQSIDYQPPRVIIPWLHSTKEQIIQEGIRLGVPFEYTSSCYDPTLSGHPCQCCDACTLRNKAFKSFTESKQERLA